VASEAGPTYNREPMPTKVWLSTHGRPLDPQEATISVFDRGFLYGDSVYETMRTAGGVVVALGAHLRRLRESAAGIAFELPFSDAELRAAIAQTLAAAGNSDSRLRVMVTRGTGPSITLDSRTAADPVCVVVVSPLVVPTEADYARGISAVLLSREGGVKPGLKTGNYLSNILALRRAHEAGADDAILCNEVGEVAEGATSNLFAYCDGEVHTPPRTSGLLAGITRALVMRLLAEKLEVPVHESTLSPEAVRGADEVLLTSSVRGIMAVTALDGAPVGEGRAGPLALRLRRAYADYLAEVARGDRSD